MMPNIKLGHGKGRWRNIVAPDCMGLECTAPRRTRRGGNAYVGRRLAIILETMIGWVIWAVMLWMAHSLLGTHSLLALLRVGLAQGS